MRKLTCPNFPNTHKKFTVSATERCSWEVDDEGNFERVIETYDSEAGDDYVCMECGHTADVEFIAGTLANLRGTTLEYRMIADTHIGERHE